MREGLRSAMGLALRELRLRQQLSLDDVEALTREGGLRVTRSHLSRVETGSADLALPRFLCLMRALGERPDAVASTLDALLDHPADGGDSPSKSARSALRAGDPLTAARLLRSAIHREGSHAARPANAILLAECEVRLGRWRGAAEALRAALSHGAPTSGLLLAHAAASIGTAEFILAEALSRSTGSSDAASLVLATSSLAAGDPTRAASVASELASRPGIDRDGLSLALSIASDAYGRLGQTKSALATARRAIEVASEPLVRADALLVAARAARRLKRPTHGLALLERARRLARMEGVPALESALASERRAIQLVAGDPPAARSALRAARAIARRAGADRDAPADLPLQSLFRRVLGHDGISAKVEANGDRSAESVP